MSFSNTHNNVEGYTAGADLSDSQYTFVKRDRDGTVIAAGAGEAAVGVLFNAPAAGRRASVVKGGNPMVYTGDVVSEGDEVAVDANGKAVTATSTNVVVGYARSTSTGADELIKIDFLGEAQFTVA